MTKPPKTPWIEAGQHHAPLRDQHTLDLPEHLVRIIRTLQSMREDKKIHATGVKRQGLRLCEHTLRPALGDAFFWERHACVGLEWNTVGAKQIHLGKTKLDGVVAKDIGDHKVKLLLLPLLDVSTGISLEPASKLYNTR